MKTIFFTLSSPAVFRNFFFFPGGFFSQLKERLKRDQNMRAVFLVYPKDYKKYAYLFEDNFGGRLILEQIPVQNPKTFLEKAFRFFYSYLIYTGTTRLMATIGTRPDEPPAGGRGYLAPLKKIIAATLGRSEFVRSRIIPRLFLKFFKERPFQSVFDRYPPQLVFVSHLYGWFDTLLLAEAKRQGVRTMGMPAGWDHLDKYYLPFKVDRLLIQSEQMKQAAIKRQFYNPKAIEIVGHPYFDFIVDKKYLLSREEIFNFLGLPLDIKVILYISGSAYCPDEPDIIETMLKWVDENKFRQDTYLVLRPYLGGRGADREFDRKKFEKFREHPKVRFWTREAWADLQNSVYFINLMRHADAIITVYSTVFLEASVFNRPILAVAFDGYKERPFSRSLRRFRIMEHFQSVIKTGAMRTAHNFEELFEILKKYFDDPKLDEKQRMLLQKEFCYELDGLASKRIADAIFEK